MAMKLSTGKVAFPIEFDNGDKDCIYFNPCDPDLAVRLNDFAKNVESRISKLDDIDLNNDGMPSTNEFVEDFRNIKTILCEELDAAFNSDVSRIVFKHCSPFAIVGGDYFVMQFIEAIKPEIEKHIKKANADVKKNMEKHLKKYEK